MELKDVYELWDRFDKSGTYEMELDMNGIHLKLKKGTNESPVISKTQSINNNNEAREDVVAVEKKEADNPGGIPVKSPLVGTFYKAAAPGEEPFISIGKEVHKGDVIGIIEAMKLMNELKAPCDGVVTDILVEDGSMVEYDQILVTIE